MSREPEPLPLLTDEQVESFVEHATQTLREHGVTLVTVPVTTHRDADVMFSNADATLDDIAPIVAGCGAKVAYLSTGYFSTADALPEDLAELAGEPVVVDFLEDVTSLEGEPEAFSLLWAADGVLFEWFAAAEWRMDVQRGLITAVADAIADLDDDDDDFDLDLDDDPDETDDTEGEAPATGRR